MGLDFAAGAIGDVVEHAPFGRVIEHVVDGDERNADLAGDCRQPRQSAGVVTYHID